MVDGNLTEPSYFPIITKDVKDEDRSVSLLVTAPSQVVGSLII
jgi:hypothetical protein